MGLGRKYTRVGGKTMQIKDLSAKEIMTVKEKATASVGIANRAYYGSGFNFAIKFAKIVEKCKCRCHNCKRPIINPWDISSSNESDNLEEFGIGVFGGDILGQISFCKDCWSRLNDRDKKRIAKEVLPKF